MEMKFKKGDRVELFLLGTNKRWTGTVLQNQSSNFVTIRVDDYIYGGEWAPGNGLCHTFESSRLTLLVSGSQSSPTDPPINDHICTTCSNNRCSKTERSCWRCGAPIQVG